MWRGQGHRDTGLELWAQEENALFLMVSRNFREVN